MKQPRYTCRMLFIFIVAYIFIVRGLNAAPSSLGKEFYISFPANSTVPLVGDRSLIITGDISASGTVTIPGLAFSYPFIVTPGSATIVNLPYDDYLYLSDVVCPEGAIHITANENISVVGMWFNPATSDSFLALPVDALGIEYIIMSYQGILYSGSSSFVITSPFDNTTVTLDLKGVSGSRSAGVPYSIVMNSGDSYQIIADSGDMTGSLITSDKPVAVIAGNSCANVPEGYDSCNYLVEQLPPSSAWGKSFFTVPFATRTGGDTFRFLAYEDSTEIWINGVLECTLNRGEFHEKILNVSSSISSNNPILVAQFSNGRQFDGFDYSDPSMMLIYSVEQYINEYNVSTPASGITNNYINVVAPIAQYESINFDGSYIPSSYFSEIGGTGYFSAALTVTAGHHHLDCAAPFGLFVYGYDLAEAYSHPGGASFDPIALYTPSCTPTITLTSTITKTQTITKTHTVSPTITKTPSVTPTFTKTGTATATTTSSVSPTITPTSTVTMSQTETATGTATQSPTAVPAATNTPEPLRMALKGNYPNPFKKETQMVYWLSCEAEVEISIFTVSGEVVLVKKGIQGLQGNNSFYWDGKNKSMNPVASGLYIYKIKAWTKNDGERVVFSKLTRVR